MLSVGRVGVNACQPGQGSQWAGARCVGSELLAADSRLLGSEEDEKKLSKKEVSQPSMHTTMELKNCSHTTARAISSPPAGQGGSAPLSTALPTVPLPPQFQNQPFKHVA